MILGDRNRMRKNDKLIVIMGVVILIISSIGIFLWVPDTTGAQGAEIEDVYGVCGTLCDVPNSITVSDDCPFYALVATPLAVHYDAEDKQEIIPLYIKNFKDPSRAVLRAEQMIGIPVDLTIGCEFKESSKNISLEIANTFWESSRAALVIEDSQTGYNLGVSAAPIASYLRIPVIVTDKIDEDVRQTFEKLGVKYTIVCGENVGGYGNIVRFTNADEIVNASIDLVREKFGDLEYITITNPTDIVEAEILNDTTYHFEGTLNSNSFTVAHIINMGLGSLKGIPTVAAYEFEVPSDYKYARVKIYAENLVDEDVEETGSQLMPMFFDPDGNWLALAFTVGGIPERDSDGGIKKDKVEWETIIYDNPGTYSLNVAGQYIASKTGDYKIDVTIEQLNSSVVPNMPGLSSIAPYLTAYHKGIIFAKPEFTFVGDESIVPNPPPGVVFPASNPDLIEDSNEHTFKIHESLNELLAKLLQMELTNEDDLKNLKNYYDKYPMYIAIVGDANMIPQYYYYDTDDACSLQYGWDVASDFLYGNIDPVPRDDKISIHPRDQFLTNYDEKYPHQENIVGRITGWDVQDASALVTRTIFYENIIDDMDEWKKTAVVQTGSGTDFQRVPFVDLLRKVIGAHDLPFKWPTGEAHFENLIVQDSLNPGGFEVRSTENTQSMRKGLSDEVLTKINKLGPLNALLFPKIRAKKILGEEIATGGIDQKESNFIFSFGHGQPMGYSHGDVQTNSIGFRPVLLQNLINRWMFGTAIPQFSSGLGNVGSYNVRYVENMDLGPSVVFIESCYIGRIDGFPAKCTTSQAYIHAGVNAFVASSRGTPGPGYLDARTSAKGFGISEYIKTQRNLELQQPHFSALHAVNIFTDLTDNDVDVGMAFRNARNKFMQDADSTFFWTPPLCLDISTASDIDFVLNNIRPTSDEEDAKCMEKKYTCLFEYNLFGDPAFNPYEPVNNG